MSVRDHGVEGEAVALDEADVFGQVGRRIANVAGPLLRRGHIGDEVATVSRDVHDSRVDGHITLQVSTDLAPNG
jgi:hypothetical protein